MNRYGYWVRTAGINTEAYAANPVLLWMHDMEGDSLPIGKLENIRVDDLNRLVADPVFDEDDDFAVKCKQKYEKGMLSACSVNIDIYSLNDAPETIKPGQKLAAVWECELLEVSLVKVPGNRDSVKLSAGEPGAVLPNITKEEVNMDFKAIAVELGIPEGSDEQAVLTAIKTLRGEAEQARKARTEALLNAAEAKGMRTSAFERMALAANANLSDLEAMVNETTAGAVMQLERTDVTQSTLSARVRAGQKNDQGNQSGEQKDDWTFDDYQRKDPSALLLMKRNEPDKYAALAANYNPVKK